MKTKQQEQLVNSFLSQLGDDIRPVYGEIIQCLSVLGYCPKKERSNISFKHDQHNKQIAKMGIKSQKQGDDCPFLALRFSACRGYSQRMDDVVRAAIAKYPTRTPACPTHDCDYCKGEPSTHIYTCEFADGTRKSHCGAYALDIPDVSQDDLIEITKLIKEEHDYLMKHEAGH